MKNISRNFNNKITQQNKSIYKEKKVNYYEINPQNISELYTETDAIKRQIKNWFYTPVSSKFFDINYGNPLINYIYSRINNFNDNFDSKEFYNKLEREIEVININREQSNINIENLNNNKILKLNLTYFISNLGDKEEITLNYNF